MLGLKTTPTEESSQVEATTGFLPGIASRRIALPAYLEVLKPRETLLLAFIGIAGAIIAAQGYPAIDRLALASLAIIAGSAGCNALTNYLDREVDARMRRTSHRALPSRRIYPPQKMLPLAIGLVALGLALAGYLHPLALLFGVIGTVAAVVGRKMWATHILGGISGCAPVLVGWIALNPRLSPTLGLICALILIWVPIHVWSLMIAYREDYLQAGVRMFPVTSKVNDATRLLFVLSLLLWATSLALYFMAGAGLIYLVVSMVLGAVVAYANLKMLRADSRRIAWRVYKLSAYPYLGLIFLAMCLDFWV